MERALLSGLQIKCDEERLNPEECGEIWFELRMIRMCRGSRLLMILEWLSFASELNFLLLLFLVNLEKTIFCLNDT